MRASDYFRLGAIGVKSRKRSTVNTILGIVFGLALLIPVLFFTVAFRADLTEKVNRSHAMSSVQLPFSDEMTAADKNTFTLRGALLDDIAAMPATRDIVRYQLFTLPPANNGAALLHEGTIREISALTLLPLRDGFMPGLPFAIKAIDPRDGLVTEGTLSDMGASSVLIAGRPFTTGRGEVILSEPLVRALGYEDPAAIVGKAVSLTASSSLSYSNGNGLSKGYYLDEDADPSNGYTPSAERYLFADIITDFKVCGVISEDYYLLNTMTYQDAHIWVSLSAVYREDGSSYLPTLTRSEGYPEAVLATYPSDTGTLAAAAAAEGMIFPAIPAVRFSRIAVSDLGLSHIAPVTSAYIECRNFEAASGLVQLFMSECASYLGAGGSFMEDLLETEGGMTLIGFSNLRLLNTVSNYIVTVMLVFGGVVLLATLLNLFNSVNYSVQMRKNYMGMLQAIGAKRSVIPKLYFVEMLLLFVIAMPFVFVLSGGISYAMKWGVDAFFASSTGQAAAGLFTATLSLNIGWFFAATAIAFAFTVPVCLLYALLACRSAVKKGVVSVPATQQ